MSGFPDRSQPDDASSAPIPSADEPPTFQPSIRVEGSLWRSFRRRDPRLQPYRRTMQRHAQYWLLAILAVIVVVATIALARA